MNLSIARAIVLSAFAMMSASAVAADVAAPAAAPAPVPTGSWPRHVKLSNALVVIYQPQVNSWTDNRLDFRSALAIKANGAQAEAFGVAFVTARTNVDKATHRVTLDNMRITRSDFPTLPDHGVAYMAELQKKLGKGVRTISLDRLKQSPALPGTAAPAAAVQNNVPRVIVSQSPAILVPIDGAPVLQPIPGNTIFQRVINTRALILQRIVEKDYFIHVFDGWLVANTIQGPWTPTFIAPPGINTVAAKINAAHVVDMLDAGPGAVPRPALANGVPTIYTSQVPTALVMFNGPPDFVPIVGTALLWATNTTSDVLVDTVSKDYFLLLAGRWFRASSLDGQWSFVASNALPPDFARIPPSSLAGVVLQTVAGTPQAQQALNETSIAQTASVPLKNGPKFAPKFDGAPQFAPIPGTSMSYVTNSPAPVVRVAPDAFYAVRAGVWFTASQVTGPWAIATSVPDAIYGIPPSSPIYYITYVRIYDVTANVVHTGYTPGYLGTAVSPSGTVVYGTGYSYASWIGNAWYPAPTTYGSAASPIYNKDTGFTYAFAIGLGTPSWTAPYLKTVYYHPGYWGSYPCCATASANVYRRYNAGANLNSADIGAGGVAAGRWTGNGPGTGSGAGQTGGSYNPQGSNPQGYNAQRYSAAPTYAPDGKPKQWQPYSLPSFNNNYYADASGNVYRQGDSGWQQNSGGNWSSASGDTSWADQESQARANSDVAAASYSMSNTTRFSGAPNSGWSAQDAGDGGYSRTLGGSGGISSEYYNYWNEVQDNAVDMWWNGGGMAYYSGIGWVSQFP
jgi:hypothetical protein